MIGMSIYCIVYAHNSHISKATGLAPNEVHIGRYPRLPMTSLSSHKQIKGVQSLKQDELDNLQLMKDKQQAAYRLVIDSDRLTKEKHRENNSKIDDTMHKRPMYEVGQWVWVYDVQHTLSTATGQTSLDREAIEELIKEKLANKWMGPSTILGVGPCKVGQKVVGSKLLYLDMPHDNQTNPRVSILRCKRCFQPYEKGNKPSFMPWEICSYVLNKFAELAPPFYLTTEDVDIELDTQRAQPLKIKAHRLNRGPGGTLNVQFETVWKGHEMSTWEDETSMAQYDGAIKRKYWCSDGINQVGADNRRFRTYQRLSALRAEHRSRSTIFCPPGYALSSSIRNGPTLLTKEMTGARIYFKMAKEGWQIGVIQDVALEEGIRLPYTVNFLDLEKRFNVALKEENYTVDLAAAPSSWCYQMFVRTKSVKRRMV